MASGTQGYQKTTTDKSLADTLISEYKKLRKKAKAGGTDEPLDPANIKFVQDSVQAVDDFIITGINGINSMFTSATADEFVPATLEGDGVIDITAEVVTESKKQTALLEQQNTLLGAFIDLKEDQLADSKRLRQEERMEDEEFLSGTQGFRKRKEDKKGGGGGGGFDLFGAIDGITDTIQLVRMFRKGKWLSKLSNLGKGFNFKNPFSKASKATNLNKVQNVLPSSSSIPFKESGTFTNLGKNAKVGEFVNVDVVPSGSSVNKFTKVADNSSNLNKVVNNGSSASKIFNKNNALTKVSGDTSKITNITEGSKGFKFLKNSPLKFAIPGLSGVSGVSNMLQGNYAEGALDLADASVDTAIATGAMSSTTGAGAVMGPAIAVTGAGLVSGWLGELTRGTDDWIRGDGTNTARNIAGDVTAGLSGALETVGAPFTALFSGVDSLIKTGGFSESNKKMAEVDTNLREGFRKFLNVWDPLNVISDEVGGFGTLRLYGEENQKNAKEQLLKDKGIINDSTNNDDSTTNNDQANAFSAENILGGDGVNVASTDLTGVLGDTNNISKVNGQNFFQTSNITTTGNLKGLTDEDYKWLAYAISGEAAQGTDDVYGVAASILNRKARGDGSIEEIIKAPGQYEAFEKGTMVDSPEIQALLQSDEGQAKLMEALRVLKGRTDFKGQSELGNRVATEDPMFDEKGNFFHYGWQTSGDSVKPEGWKPVNWQQYMPGEGIEGAQGLSNKLNQQVAGLSSETSNSPTFIFIPSTSGSNNNVASNEGATAMNFGQLPTENKNLDLYKFNSFQRLNA